MESQKADSSVGCGSTKEKDAAATPPACRYPHCLSETKLNCTVDTILAALEPWMNVREPPVDDDESNQPPTAVCSVSH